MVDANRLLKTISGSGLLGGLAGGAVSGALLGSKKARKTATSALKVGGIAALGGLAYRAYQNYQVNQAGATNEFADTAVVGQTPIPSDPALPEAFKNLAAEAETADSQQLLLVRAMIAAAMADGHVTPSEQTRVLSKIAGSDLSSAERALLLDEIHSPLRIDQLVSEVHTPALAFEVYLASAMVIDDGCAQGERHMKDLAEGLGLQPPLVEALNQQAQTQAAA